MTAIEITSREGSLRLYNIYNDGNHQDTLQFMARHLATQQQPEIVENDSSGIILLGDFNRHHPLWDDPSNHHLFSQVNMNAAQPLLDILASHDLRMALLPSVPTLHAKASASKRCPPPHPARQLDDALQKWQHRHPRIPRIPTRREAPRDGSEPSPLPQSDTVHGPAPLTAQAFDGRHKIPGHPSWRTSLTFHQTGSWTLRF